jgi:hypothetical protein
MDPLVVRTDDLVRVLEPIIREQDVVYRGVHGCSEHAPLKSNNRDSPVMTGREMLGTRAGLGKASLLRHFLKANPTQRTTNTCLEIADSLLTACCQSHALQDGRVPVYKSPRWKVAGWEREMRARGVDDPWGIVADERPLAAAA